MATFRVQREYSAREYFRAVKKFLTTDSTWDAARRATSRGANIVKNAAPTVTEAASETAKKGMSFGKKLGIGAAVTGVGAAGAGIAASNNRKMKEMRASNTRSFRVKRVMFNAVDNITQPVAAVGNTVANTANRASGGVTGAVSGTLKGLGTLAENPIKTAIGVGLAPVTGGLSLIPAAAKVAGSTLKGAGEGIEKGV